MTQEEKITLLQAQLKEAIDAFEEYFYATDEYNNGYCSERMDAISDRLWKLKREVKQNDR
jgi:hypothetical protein